MERPNPKADIVAHQVVEHSPGGTNLVVLVEDEADDVAHLLVGADVDPIGKELDVAQRHVVEELAALGLVQSASLQSISHSNNFGCALFASSARSNGGCNMGWSCSRRTRRPWTRARGIICRHI
jgi:hypothetical protein